MIYTVTFNPSLDYIMFVPVLNVGGVSRARKESLYPGGKGINVAVVLERLGFACTALGFSAGYTGRAMQNMLEGHITNTGFIGLEQGQNRINVKIKSEAESDVNGCGPLVSPEKFDELLARLEGLRNGDVLVLAGAVSPGLDADTYEKILCRLAGRGVLTVVDATGNLLKNALKYRPFLIKPNALELAALFGQKPGDMQDSVKLARAAQELGARNVLVSHGAQGALLVVEDGRILRAGAVKLPGPVVNSVGAGDSMVAGFLAGWLRTGDYARALDLAVACGGACVTREWLPQRQDIAALVSHPTLYFS